MKSDMWGIQRRKRYEVRNPSKKRVLMLVENLSFPEDPRVRQEAFALAASGYQVSVISPRNLKQSRQVIQDVHVYRYPAPQEGSGFVSYLWEYSYSLASTFLLSLLVWARMVLMLSILPILRIQPP
jgi:hypothetical protein